MCTKKYMMNKNKLRKKIKIEKFAAYQKVLSSFLLEGRVIKMIDIDIKKMKQK